MEERFHLLVGLRFGIVLGLWHDSRYWLGLGLGSGLRFRSEIRAQGL